MAEDQDKSQKTEQPTEQRLKKAREEGQIAFSKEIGHWFILFAFALSLVYLFPKSFKKLLGTLGYFLDSAAQIPVSPQNMMALIRHSFLDLLIIMGFPFLALIIAALIGGGLQTGFRVSAKPLKPKLSKISIREGFKRIFGTKSLVEFVKNLFKMLIIITVTYFALKPEFDKLHALPQLSMIGLLRELDDAFLLLLTVTLSVLLLIALLDYGWQKYQMLVSLRMSKQEIKEEFKEMEGDPHLKAKVRQIREERARNRMMADVPSATAILMNPTHYAVAIFYEQDAPDPPKVVAKGRGEIAFKIKEVGEKHDIPIIQNPPLTRALYKHVEIGKTIPREYFEAVARVIRYVFGFDPHYKDHLDEGLDPGDLER